MISNECENVVFKELEEKIYLFRDKTDEEYEIDVHFDHDKKEIRLINIPIELEENEKKEIMYAIIQRCVLYPNYNWSLNATIGNIAEYVILFNGYKSDGTYREPGSYADSIITELVKSNMENEPSSLSMYKDLIESFSSEYLKKDKGNAVSITFCNKKSKDIVKSLGLLITAYLKDKGINISYYVFHNFFNKKATLYAYDEEI